MGNDSYYKKEGNEHKVLARERNISQKSVRKYLKSELKSKHKMNKGPKLDPYGEKIREMIDENNLLGVRILKEIRQIEYNGGYTIMKDYCHELRKDRKIQAVCRYETESGKKSLGDVTTPVTLVRLDQAYNIRMGHRVWPSRSILEYDSRIILLTQ